MADDSKSSAPLLAAIAVAVIGAIGTYMTVSSSKAQHEEDLKIKKQEIADKHREEYVARFREHKAKEAQMISAAPGQYYAIYFANQCARGVDVTVRYVALDGVVSVVGWFHFAPNEAPAHIFKTQSKYFSYYAKDLKGEVQWTGDARQTVTRQMFEYMDDEDFRDGWFPLPEAREVKFSDQTITLGNYGKWTVPLTCPGK